MALPSSPAELDPAVPPLKFVDMPASPARLVEVRQALVAWATAIGLPDDLVEDIVLATYEGLINATEHAYTADPRRLDLVAGLMMDGWLLVTVRDYGRWRRPPADPGFRGRGLMMIHNLPDRAEVRPSADGTVVQMAWNTALRVGRAAQHQEGDVVEAGAPEPFEEPFAQPVGIELVHNGGSQVLERDVQVDLRILDQTVGDEHE